MAPSPDEPPAARAVTPKGTSLSFSTPEGDNNAPLGRETADGNEQGGFRVAVGEFEGPFDLLLSLITKHELDITEISLSRVTDEFIAYLRRLDADQSLDEASEFLLVAATLLDLKIAGLLPQGELVDAEDVALLEARDLLFARLLQYRAFKVASAWFSARLDTEAARHARTVRLEDKYRQRTPELVWTLTADDFAALATLAMTPREIPVVGLDHLHAPLVSIREQAAVVVGMLRSGDQLSFRAARRGRRAEGRRDRALPRGARAVPARGHRVRAAGAPGRADLALDGRALVGGEPVEPGSRL